jgi:hypothetical protein
MILCRILMPIRLVLCIISHPTRPILLCGHPPTQVSGRAVDTGAALIGEGRNLMQDHAGTSDGARAQRQGSERSSTTHNKHPSGAGLLRRKLEGGEGLKMVSHGPSSAAANTKDE